ncbi:MAG TPA: methylated-DNA--[protein]-cysteine S-methyltransferase [Steroidobacteraceae bacterium]|nr:methylated-DNA--[protein]-cysteine S-methyltransferase [Steroidobacteraceae bacterium]
MTAPLYAIFPTSIGTCGILWSGRGILGVQLPESNETALRARIVRRYPQARAATPDTPTAAAITRITALLAGAHDDLGSLALDYTGISEFERDVYEAARRVGPGSVSSYGELAARVGDRHASRAIGQAMARNPFPLIVPCHRILAADGGLGGFSARGGTSTKQRLLEIEGAPVAVTLPLF